MEQKVAREGDPLVTKKRVLSGHILCRVQARPEGARVQFQTATTKPV